MSALIKITQPSGTITVGQTVNYTFAFDGPYPVSWTFSQFGNTVTGTATNNNSITQSSVVPSDPNTSIGSLSFSGPGEAFAHTFKLSPFDGFSEIIYPKLQTDVWSSLWNTNAYGNYIIVTNNSTKTMTLGVYPLGNGAPLTTGSFPMTVYLTRQQVYPTPGTETTVSTQTFNTIGTYADGSYTAPAVASGSAYKYRLYTTNPSATGFTADTTNTKGSVILISSTQAPFIYGQPSNTTVPYTVGSITYNSTVIGVKYISAGTPTVTWYRNGSPVPGSWVVPIANYGGYDSSISVDNVNCNNGDTFYCTIVDANGSVTSSTVTLTVNAAPPAPDAVSVSISVTPGVDLAVGTSMTLAAQTIATGSVTYQWYQNNVVIPGATSQTYTKSVQIADNNTTFKVMATCGTAAATSSGILISTYVPSASTPFIAGTPVSFQALASTVNNPGSTFTYTWAFDDGSCLVGNPVSKPMDALGAITATVTAVDNVTGGTATASKTIHASWSSWNAHTAFQRAWNPITYGNGLFVMAAEDTLSVVGAIATSPDGVIWTPQTAPVTGNYEGAAFGNSTFVLAASTNRKLIYSTDGANWQIATADARAWWGVAFGGGKFVAIASGGGVAGEAATSTDGINWTARTVSSDQFWNAICYGNGKFVTVCTGTATMTSPDGINWTTGTCPNGTWRDVAYGNGIYIAITTAVTSGQAMWSTDGLNWNQVTLPDAVQIGSVSYGNGWFIITPTQTGLTWGSYLTRDCQTFYKVQTDVVNRAWQGSAYGNGRFVATNTSNQTVGQVQVMLW